MRRPRSRPTAKHAATARKGWVVICFSAISAATFPLAAAARPGLVIVHCTAPLREPDHGAKAAVKKAVGVGPDAANANRGRYNELLRKRFADGAVFDVARAESRRLDGTEETVVVKDERWPALAPEYGQGARELTEAGRIVLGREFLLAISTLCADATHAKPGVATVPVGEDARDD